LKSFKQFYESIDVWVPDAPQDDDFADTLLKLTYYLQTEVLSMRDYTAEEKQRWPSLSGIIEPDGTDVFDPTGVINLYVRSFPPRLIEKLVKDTVGALGDLGIKVGKPVYEETDGSLRVIRVPVLENDISGEGLTAPSLNLANESAIKLFRDILQFNDFDWDGMSVGVYELQHKIRQVLPQRMDAEVEDQRTEKGEKGATNIYSGYSKERLQRYLDKLQEIVDYAIEHDFDSIQIS
tara:strand:+ start:373 stop:1080 length:708 start_codon:yes stop_codon:yes gene_type:complete